MALEHKCIVCKEKVKQVDFESEVIHPYDALHFLTYGHYGSGIFDPISEPKQLDVVICDLCIMENLDCVYGTGAKDLKDNYEMYYKSAKDCKDGN